MNWINVEDRLPENDRLVLTYSHEYGIVIGGYTNDKYEQRWHAEYTDGEVSYANFYSDEEMGNIL